MPITYIDRWTVSLWPRYRRSPQRQIADQFRYQRHFPAQESHLEQSHGRQLLWELRARNSTDSIRERWIGDSWIIELVCSGKREDKRFRHVYHLITAMRTSSKALLRLVRQRWVIENKWHWVRDVQLGEDAHRYAERNGVQALALLRTLSLNLLRTNGYPTTHKVVCPVWN